VVGVPVALADLLLLGLQVQLVALVELELVQLLLDHPIPLELRVQVAQEDILRVVAVADRSRMHHLNQEVMVEVEQEEFVQVEVELLLMVVQALTLQVVVAAALGKVMPADLVVQES